MLLESKGTSVPFFTCAGEQPRTNPLIIFHPMSHLLRQPPVDLFGEVPVTENDLYDWVAAVSPVHLSERGFDHYVRRYDVAAKIRVAKLRGSFESICARPKPVYHARLALQRIV